jgi:ribosomal protein S27AE
MHCIAEVADPMQLCPNCAGKGHVMSGLVGPGGPFVWVFALFERHDPDGLTRDVCGRCGGSGFVDPTLDKHS